LGGLKAVLPIGC